jgi:hypothetical protein
MIFAIGLYDCNDIKSTTHINRINGTNSLYYF